MNSSLSGGISSLGPPVSIGISVPRRHSRVQRAQGTLEAGRTEDVLMGIRHSLGCCVLRPLCLGWVKLFLPTPPHPTPPNPTSSSRFVLQFWLLSVPTRTTMATRTSPSECVRLKVSLFPSLVFHFVSFSLQLGEEESDRCVLWCGHAA